MTHDNASSSDHPSLDQLQQGGGGLVNAADTSSNNTTQKGRKARMSMFKDNHLSLKFGANAQTQDGGGGSETSSLRSKQTRFSSAGQLPLLAPSRARRGTVREFGHGNATGPRLAAKQSQEGSTNVLMLEMLTLLHKQDTQMSAMQESIASLNGKVARMEMTGSMSRSQKLLLHDYLPPSNEMAESDEEEDESEEDERDDG
jgi:hypothetical protein